MLGKVIDVAKLTGELCMVASLCLVEMTKWTIMVIIGWVDLRDGLCLGYPPTPPEAPPSPGSNNL